MASDLLSTIRDEIHARLSDLRPLLAEYEQLLAAVEALDEGGAVSASLKAPTAVTTTVKSRAARRNAAAGSPAASSNAGTRRSGRSASRARSAGTAGRTRAGKPRAGRGAAREAILAALEHGSHTINELVMVTAMSSANISGNVRRLLAEGAISKGDRGGKAAYQLVGGA